MVGRQSLLSVCLYSVFATPLAAVCERIHTVSLSSIPHRQRTTAKLGVQDVRFLLKAILMLGWILMIGVTSLTPFVCRLQQLQM